MSRDEKILEQFSPSSMLSIIPTFGSLSLPEFHEFRQDSYRILELYQDEKVFRERRIFNGLGVTPLSVEDASS